MRQVVHEEESGEEMTDQEYEELADRIGW